MTHVRRQAGVGAFAILAILAPGRAAAGDGPLRIQWRWVYAGTNFDSAEKVDELIALMERAKNAGYNGMIVIDGKFGKIRGRARRYYGNLKRVRKAARRLDLEVIAAIGHYMTMTDQSLAEGIAVEDCRFVVKEGKAVVANQENLLPGGGFEEEWKMAGTRDLKTPPGFDWIEGPEVSAFRDTEVKRSGESSLRMESFRLAGNAVGNARFFKMLKLEPWKQYVLKFWLKTRDLSSGGGVRVGFRSIASPSDDSAIGMRPLNYTPLNVEPTQDWREYSVVFNTMDYADQVRMYMGIWGGKEGTFWMDDVELTQTAGINLIRREGCPVTVESEDGAEVYEEGRDFERWEYPLDRGYAATHPAPPIVIKEGSRIREGQQLKVSYYHTTKIGRRGPPSCMSAEGFFEHFEDLVRVLHKYLRPDGYHMKQNSELRLAGHCALCKREGETAGDVVAENADRCLEIIRRVNPDAKVTVWSDMFDPHHNARDNYALCGSTMKGSWEIDPAICIANWNGRHRRESLTFFSGRGPKQIIAGYYDSGRYGEEAVRKKLLAWLEAAEGVEGVMGVMYTTWRGDYEYLEAYAKILDEYESGSLKTRP